MNNALKITFGVIVAISYLTILVIASISTYGYFSNVARIHDLQVEVSKEKAENEQLFRDYLEVLKHIPGSALPKVEPFKKPTGSLPIGSLPKE